MAILWVIVTAYTLVTASNDRCDGGCFDVLVKVVFGCREFSEIYVIDHSTTSAEAAGTTGGRSGRGGEILYRWGNPAMYGRGTAADQQFGGQHDVHWLSSDVPGRSLGEQAHPPQRLMVFNNINTSRGRGDERSSVVMLDPPVPDPTTGAYALDDALDDSEAGRTGSSSSAVASSTSGGGYLPKRPSWCWDKRGFTANHISGAQMLGNGNVVVTNGETGDIVEVTEAGRVVWEFNWTVNGCASNHPPRPNRSAALASLAPPPHYPPVGNCFFRTYRYPASYSGLREHARDLLTAIECGPSLNAVGTATRLEPPVALDLSK